MAVNGAARVGSSLLLYTQKTDRGTDIDSGKLLTGVYSRMLL